MTFSHHRAVPIPFHLYQKLDTILRQSRGFRARKSTAAITFFVLIYGYLAREKKHAVHCYPPSPCTRPKNHFVLVTFFERFSGAAKFPLTFCSFQRSNSLTSWVSDVGLLLARFRCVLVMRAVGIFVYTWPLIKVLKRSRFTEKKSVTRAVLRINVYRKNH